jgi:hypothetical protein
VGGALTQIATNCAKVGVVLTTNYFCAPCDDGKKSPGETDIDCGGTCPNKCAAGLHCTGAADCTGSGGCSRGGICLAAANATATDKSLTKADYGIIVAVIGGLILIVGFVATWKWWYPMHGGEGNTAFSPVSHEGVEMESVKSDRGVSVVDDQLTASPTHADAPGHEEDVYVS